METPEALIKLEILKTIGTLGTLETLAFSNGKVVQRDKHGWYWYGIPGNDMDRLAPAEISWELKDYYDQIKFNKFRETKSTLK